MLGDYRFVIEMDLVIDMADEFESLYGISARADDMIEAIMGDPPERFDHELLNVDGMTAYFIAMPPRKWVDGLAMVRKLARV